MRTPSRVGMLPATTDLSPLKNCAKWLILSLAFVWLVGCSAMRERKITKRDPFNDKFSCGEEIPKGRTGASSQTAATAAPATRPAAAKPAMAKKGPGNATGVTGNPNSGYVNSGYGATGAANAAGGAVNAAYSNGPYGTVNYGNPDYPNPEQAVAATKKLNSKIATNTPLSRGTADQTDAGSFAENDIPGNSSTQSVVPANRGLVKTRRSIAATAAKSSDSESARRFAADPEFSQAAAESVPEANSANGMSRPYGVASDAEMTPAHYTTSSGRVANSDDAVSQTSWYDTDNP